MNVSGVARDNNCARVAIINLDDTPGTAFKVFSLMAKHHVNIDIILQSVGRDNKKSISFTIRQDDAERVESILRDAKEMLGYEDLSIKHQRLQRFPSLVQAWLPLPVLLPRCSRLWLWPASTSA